MVRPAGSTRTVSAQTFTVIHGGGEIDDSTASAITEEASSWVTAAGPGVTRLVEVWAASGRRLVLSCLASAAALGGPACTMYLPAVDGLVRAMKARGLVVRHRQTRRSVTTDAELDATCREWPVRYV